MAKESWSPKSLSSMELEGMRPMEPNWVESLIRTKFWDRESGYDRCPKHPNGKNELKMFCTETEEKICEGCLADHEGHCVVRVCRYMYTDVVPMANLEKQLNVSCVQSYINNGHRVLYLDRTNQQKSKLAQTGTCCRRCGRTLADGFLYCSVRCMLDSTRPEVSSEGRRGQGSESPTLECITESSPSEAPRTPPIRSRTLALPAASTPIRKGRRKGVPHESPISRPREICLIRASPLHLA